MNRLTVVLSSATSPNLGAWNDELQASGFDLHLDPTALWYDDPRSVPVVIRGRHSVIEFELVPATPQADWFPLGMLTVRQPQQVAFVEWSDEFAEAAAMAAAATLAKLYHGVVFDVEGIHGMLSVTACHRAHELFARLPTE